MVNKLSMLQMVIVKKAYSVIDNWPSI